MLVEVVLRGLAQVAFAERPIAGVLVLAGIAVVSLDPPARSLAPGDLVACKAEEVLPAPALLLDCPNGRVWGMNRRNVRSARAA